MSDEEIMHDDIDDGKSMKLSRYDIDPQYNDPDPDYRPRNESVLPVEPINPEDVYVEPLSETKRVFNIIEAERQRQDKKWGQQNHKGEKWMLIAVEEIGEIAKAILEKDTLNYYLEIIQAAAVLTAWAESEMRHLDKQGIELEDIVRR